MIKKNFILFSNCIPVKGAKRSIICDTQNNKYYLIPNGLYHILVNYNCQSIDFVKNEFDNKQNKIIDSYFDFLLSNNLIFFSSNPEFFPTINLEWDSPSLITNAIIDYDSINHDFENIIKQLEYLKCSNIQLRFFKRVSIDFIKNLLEIIKKEESRITSIDLIFPYISSPKSELNLIIKNFPRIHALILFNSPTEKDYQPINGKMGFLKFIKKNILNEKHCGIISTAHFYSNIKLFSESIHHNTCLNRKIAIDKNGEIKNCPSMNTGFGNILDTKLIDVVKNKSFKKYWNITKDQIQVCKDCEFRHICTDCRAYIENPTDKLSKPLKCGYNPYTNVWEKWSKNPLKEKAIEYYAIDVD